MNENSFEMICRSTSNFVIFLSPPIPVQLTYVVPVPAIPGRIKLKGLPKYDSPLYSILLKYYSIFGFMPEILMALVRVEDLTDHHYDPEVNFTGCISMSGSSLVQKPSDIRRIFLNTRPNKLCDKGTEKCLLLNLL